MYENKISIKTDKKGLYKITDLVENEIKESKIKNGICFLFIPHTSASIIIQEVDLDAQKDMEYFLEKLVPEIDQNYKHQMEGPDDPSSHIKGAILNNSQIIFVNENKPVLGRWQDIYLWEHRKDNRNRFIDVRIVKQ